MADAHAAVGRHAVARRRSDARDGAHVVPDAGGIERDAITRGWTRASRSSTSRRGCASSTASRARADAQRLRSRASARSTSSARAQGDDMIADDAAATCSRRISTTSCTTTRPRRCSRRCAACLASRRSIARSASTGAGGPGRTRIRTTSSTPSRMCRSRTSAGSGRSWFFEPWPLDQAIATVKKQGDSTAITIEDRGLAPMPVELAITRAERQRRAHAQCRSTCGCSGARTHVVRVARTPDVTRVEIDPDGFFPDIDRSNQLWSRRPRPARARLIAPAVRLFLEYLLPAHIHLTSHAQTHIGVFVMRLVLASALALRHLRLQPSRRTSRRPAKRARSPWPRRHGFRLREPSSDPVLRGLQWRLVGPFRGGRAVAVTGDPVEPRRSTSAAWTAASGRRRTRASRGTTSRMATPTIASVGAIAVAPSDPNVIYVGGGEADFREDLTYGDGMYRSTDGGRSWKHIGLEQTRQIARIRRRPARSRPRLRRGVRPRVRAERRARRLSLERRRQDVAARAVRRRLHRRDRRRDGSARTRASSTRRCGTCSATRGASAPAAARAVSGRAPTAATRGRRSRDNPGMPTCRSAASACRCRRAIPQRVYATSRRRPTTRSAASSAPTTPARPGSARTATRSGWCARGTTRPHRRSARPNTVYVMNLCTWKSIDGGHTFTRMRVPHGDTHVLWIDPNDSQRMINGNDGGATISARRRRDWSIAGTSPPRSSITS